MTCFDARHAEKIVWILCLFSRMDSAEMTAIIIKGA